MSDEEEDGSPSWHPDSSLSRDPVGHSVTEMQKVLNYKEASIYLEVKKRLIYLI